jgi:lipopolysaccharide biosynthesis regulator YciM
VIEFLIAVVAAIAVAVAIVACVGLSLALTDLKLSRGREERLRARLARFEGDGLMGTAHLPVFTCATAGCGFKANANYWRSPASRCPRCGSDVIPYGAWSTAT